MECRGGVLMESEKGLEEVGASEGDSRACDGFPEGVVQGGGVRNAIVKVVNFVGGKSDVVRMKPFARGSRPEVVICSCWERW